MAFLEESNKKIEIFPSTIEMTSPFSVFPILERKVCKNHVLNELFHIKSFQHFKDSWIKLFWIPILKSPKDVQLSRELTDFLYIKKQ